MRSKKKQEYDIIYPNPAPDGVVLEKNVIVKMRDGVAMAADIYRPEYGDGPWPAILAYSPFQKERSFESAKPEFYCKNGYVCVQAAERGSGFNEGKFEFHGTKAAQDGYDLVEWIADQPWCTGNVAMMGASGYGVMSWLTAALNPPHLKALAVLATTDNYRGLCYPGGVLRKGFVMNLMFGLTQATIWPGPIPGKEQPLNIVAEILSNPEDGPFWWEHGSSWTKINQIKTPVMNIMSAPNRLHSIYHLRSYPEIKSEKKLVITPWTNENYQPWIFETTAMNQYILRWLDYWLKGNDTGIMDEPEVAVYDNGIGKWYYENEYPLKRTRWEKYYLHGKRNQKETAGVIDQAKPEEREKAGTYDNVNLNFAMLASYGIDATPSTQSHYLVYFSDPLPEDIRIWGPVSVILYASTTETVTSDLSFFVKLGEMVPDGVPLNPVTREPEAKPEATDPWVPKEVQLWSWGSLKAKYREVDETKSKPGMPWHPYQNSQELIPNRIYELQIEMQPVFKTFKKGNRIWLKIASDDAAYSTIDCTSRYVETPLGAENRKISIQCNTDFPSHILLPVIPEVLEDIQVNKPLCDALPGALRFIKKV